MISVFLWKSFISLTHSFQKAFFSGPWKKAFSLTLAIYAEKCQQNYSFEIKKYGTFGMKVFGLPSVTKNEKICTFTSIDKISVQNPLE